MSSVGGKHFCQHHAQHSDTVARSQDTAWVVAQVKTVCTQSELQQRYFGIVSVTEIGRQLQAQLAGCSVLARDQERYLEIPQDYGKTAPLSSVVSRLFIQATRHKQEPLHKD